MRYALHAGSRVDKLAYDTQVPYLVGQVEARDLPLSLCDVRAFEPTPKAFHDKAQGERSGVAAKCHPGAQTRLLHQPRRGLNNGGTPLGCVLHAIVIPG